jgi:hypothetical protein
LAKKAGNKGKGARESLVVGSKVKAYVRSKGGIVAGDLLSAVSAKVYELLDAAVERSKGNKRSTVRPQDL